MKVVWGDLVSGVFSPNPGGVNPTNPLKNTAAEQALGGGNTLGVNKAWPVNVSIIFIANWTYTMFSMYHINITTCEHILYFSDDQQKPHKWIPKPSIFKKVDLHSTLSMSKHNWKVISTAPNNQKLHIDKGPPPILFTITRHPASDTLHKQRVLIVNFMTWEILIYGRVMHSL
jgi:hypothetical protein